MRARGRRGESGELTSAIGDRNLAVVPHVKVLAKCDRVPQVSLLAKRSGGLASGEGLVLGGVYELVLDVVDTSGQLGGVQLGWTVLVFVESVLGRDSCECAVSGVVFAWGEIPQA